MKIVQAHNLKFRSYHICYMKLERDTKIFCLIFVYTKKFQMKYNSLRYSNILVKKYPKITDWRGKTKR